MKKSQEKNEILEEELLEEGADTIRIEDKRRFDDAGERVEVKINGGADEATDPVEPPKPAEVLKLEKELNEITVRCQSAEAKLGEVQLRFEKERENLEKETAEMRTRMKKSLEQQADQSRFDFLTSLLPVLDNLNLAITAAEQDASLDHLVDGVNGTARSFEKALISVGVEPVAAIGEKFDPQLHEAVDTIETDEESEGIITAEYARGYIFNGRLLRPARVQVGTVARSQSG